MSKLEMVRQALEQLGEVPSVEISSFIQRCYGVRIDPKFIPIVRASLRELEMLQRFREEARAYAGQADD
jgi:hypothetical protein